MSQFGRHDRHGVHDAQAAREALALRKQRRRAIKRKDFEGLEVSAVWELANADGADVPPGSPEYYDRPWTQLRDEMVTRKAKTVGQLPPDRIKIYRRTTRWVPRLDAVVWWLSRSRRGKLLARIFVHPVLVHLARLPDRQNGS